MLAACVPAAAAADVAAAGVVAEASVAAASADAPWQQLLLVLAHALPAWHSPAL